MVSWYLWMFFDLLESKEGSVPSSSPFAPGFWIRCGTGRDYLCPLWLRVEQQLLRWEAWSGFQEEDQGVSMSTKLVFVLGLQHGNFLNQLFSHQISITYQTKETRKESRYLNLSTLKEEQSHRPTKEMWRPYLVSQSRRTSGGYGSAASCDGDLVGF